MSFLQFYPIMTTVHVRVEVSGEKEEEGVETRYLFKLG
jgi:hypothetical protein